MAEKVLRQVVPPARREIEVEIGDTKQPDFYPQWKSLHWGNEANFSVRLSDDAPTQGVVTQVGDVVEWARAGRKARIYPIEGWEDGGYELEVELAAKPASNVLSFTLETKGFDFYYQPALTQEEIDAGLERPENVVGSYAVYHATKRGNFIGGKQYRTGKAFHIYRPWAEDAKGTRVWCELHIDAEAKLLTITVPQDFLDAATYPVLVDPTFGYTTAGASSGTIYRLPRAHSGTALRYAASSGDVVTKMSAHAATDISGFTSSGDAGVYEFNTGTARPTNLVGSSAISTSADGSDFAWRDTATLALALEAGKTYVAAATGTGNGPRLSFDSGSGNQRSGMDAITGPLPSVWVHSGYSNTLLSFYATYENSGSGGTAYNDSITESVTASDALGAAVAANVSVSEAGSASDSLSTGSTFSESVTESATAADSVAGTANVNVAAQEAASAADAIAGSATVNVAITETGTAADAISTGSVFSDAISESVTAADALAPAVSANPAISEAASAADAIAAAATINAAVSEAGSAADAVSAGNTFSDAITETATATDAIASAWTANESVTESASATDALALQQDGVERITESLNAQDSYEVEGGTVVQVNTAPGGVKKKPQARFLRRAPRLPWEREDEPEPVEPRVIPKRRKRIPLPQVEAIRKVAAPIPIQTFREVSAPVISVPELGIAALPIEDDEDEELLLWLI